MHFTLAKEIKQVEGLHHTTLSSVVYWCIQTQKQADLSDWSSESLVGTFWAKLSSLHFSG